MRYAEEANYWTTTVHPAKSQAEIIEMLEDFGTENVITMQGKAGTKFAWLIRFQWDGRPYRFVFVPLECKNPEKTYSFSGKKRSAEKQARYQMGRIASHFVKAILTAAETNPASLFGFLELAGKASSGSLPPTTAEVEIDDLISRDPPILLLPDVISDLDRIE